MIEIFEINRSSFHHSYYICEMNRIKRLIAIMLLLGMMAGATGCKLFKKDCHCPSFGQVPVKNSHGVPIDAKNKPC